MGILRNLFFEQPGASFACPYCGESTPQNRRPANYNYSLDGPRMVYSDCLGEAQGGFALRDAEWQEHVCWHACCMESHPPIVGGAWCIKCLGKVSRNDSNWKWENWSYRRIAPRHNGACPPRA